MGRKAGEDEGSKAAAWFALELGERKQQLDWIYEDLSLALQDGMFLTAHAQAVALSLHAQALSRALVARPSTVIDASQLN